MHRGAPISLSCLTFIHELTRRQALQLQQLLGMSANVDNNQLLTSHHTFSPVRKTASCVAIVLAVYNQWAQVADVCGKQLSLKKSGTVQTRLFFVKEPGYESRYAQFFFS